MSTANNFVHLRLHSEYTLNSSILRINTAIELAKQDNMYALALTDLHNMFGVIKYYKACLRLGIKPILGAELNVESPLGYYYKIIVLAKNIAGYHKICQLITTSYLDNKILDIPYVKEQWLLDNPSVDIIILSGGIYGDIGQLIEKSHYKQALDKVMLWAAAYPKSYYLELQRISVDKIDLFIEQTLAIADKLGVPVVATHPIEFANQSEYLAHEVRVCIANGERLDSIDRVSDYTSEQYFLSSQAMLERFSDIPSSLTNSIEIAKRCNVEIILGEYFLPNFITPNNYTLEEYLATLSQQGLEQRLELIIANYDNSNEPENIVSQYKHRLEIEVETITKMGFTGYFLIVSDFINWAKSNNIPVGPGRGSGAGSLVAYSLGITDLDPIKYGLLFERFLNIDRVSMPDFDIDFCQDKRELVIDYIKKKYGASVVAQIATFGTMSSKAVIKDVGRALALPYGLCDSLSKLILNTPVKSYSLLDAYAKFEDLARHIDNGDDDVKRLWELSLQLEDLPRSVGKHAAGVLIASKDLTNFCPLYVSDGMQTSQLDKDDVESVGLVKFDFLGLRNLTIIQETIENIYLQTGQRVTLSNYSFNDPEVYKLLQQGNTCAIFQLESPGMKRVLVKLAPDRFEDIIALLALYRPGPLGSGMVDDFIKRKNGQAVVNYFHDDLKNCLETTYGVILYQEQVMQISQIIGGYSLGSADLLRRAMGKKKPEEMALHKSTFLDGARLRGYTSKLAEELFDLMAKFAEYGFNKSHSAAYAVISYHTAYLKAHYKAHFMAATLSSELDRTDKLYEFYQDCRLNNLEILAPDINQSYYKFLAIDHSRIRYGLGAIKGIGFSVVEKIVKERSENGDFTSFIDFCSRVNKKVLNKKSLESLVRCGAFDSLDNNRAKLFDNSAKILEFVEIQQQNKQQDSLFDILDNGESLAKHALVLDEREEWTTKELLHMEKLSLGYYYSASLFDEYNDIITKLKIPPLLNFGLEIPEIQNFINNKNRTKLMVMAVGIINYIGSRPLKKGGKMFFVNIEDKSGSIELVLYKEEYEKYYDLIKLDNLIFVSGELMYDAFREQIKITAKEIYNLDSVLAKQVKSIEFDLTSKSEYEALVLYINNCDDGASVEINYTNDIAKCILITEANVKFRANFESLTCASKLLGSNNWRFKKLEDNDV